MNRKLKTKVKTKISSIDETLNYGRSQARQDPIGSASNVLAM
jgi:hypothetical protein